LLEHRLGYDTIRLAGFGRVDEWLLVSVTIMMVFAVMTPMTARPIWVVFVVRGATATAAAAAALFRVRVQIVVFEIL
jgi:hypothetical protein